MNERQVDVLVVGAGPAGLACAMELVRMGLRDVLVLDREKEAGGVPRLCGHLGFGMRDLRRVLSGPGYARFYREAARKRGIQVRTQATAGAWTGERSLLVSSPEGLEVVSARAILLATGCRERPRPARLIPGYRPKGVFNTGSLQDFVFGYGMKVGERAVVAGAELVSYSAIHTLRKGGCRTLFMTTEYERDQVYPPYTPYKWWASGFHKVVPLRSRTRITDIFGKGRLEAVELEDAATGGRTRVPCDTLVLTGDWIPEHEAARLGELEMDRGTRGPAVDGELRTSREGIFAAGNLLRGAEPGDVAALEGRYAARSIVRYLEGETWPSGRVRVEVREPILWVSPNRIVPGSGAAPRRRFLFRVGEFLKGAKVTVSQEGRILVERPFRFLGPNYSWRLDPSWAEKVVEGPPVVISLDGARR